MANPFSKSVENVKTVLPLWSQIVEFLHVATATGGEKFNQDVVVPGTEQLVQSFDFRVRTILGLVTGLEKSETSVAQLIPKEYLAKLDKTLEAIKESIVPVVEVITRNKGNEIVHLDPNSWQVTFGNTNDTPNFASQLQTINSHIEALLVAYYQIAPIVKAKKIGDFSETTRALSEKLSEVLGNASKVAETKTNVEQNALAIGEQKTQTAEDRDKIAGILEEINKMLEKIKQGTETSESNFDNIAKIAENADSLKGRVEAYASDFETFEKELRSRNAEHKNLTQALEDLLEALKEKDEDIGKTIKRADAMLAGATNASLAKTFKETLKGLEEKLDDARKSFYRSIGFLFVSAIPLAIYFVYLTLAGDAVPIPDNNGSNGFFARDGIDISTTAVLASLMVPAAWLARFSVARHRQLFLLKEHYQYKYTLAMAVEGFKKQAPNFEDAVAAETFNRLLFNPAGSLEKGGDEDDHPSPLMKWLMNMFGFDAKGESTRQ